MRWAGHAAPVGEKRGAFRVLMGKYEGKMPHKRPWYRLQSNTG